MIVEYSTTQHSATHTQWNHIESHMAQTQTQTHKLFTVAVPAPPFTMNLLYNSHYFGKKIFCEITKSETTRIRNLNTLDRLTT